MSLQLQQLSANDVSSIACGVMGIIITVFLLPRLSHRSKLDAFPIVGSSTLLGSYWTAIKFISKARSLMQEGYEKHKSAPFRIPEPYHWTVIFSDPRYVEELAKASDDDFSFLEAIDSQIHVRYTVGREVVNYPYHIETIRMQLTRNLQVLYPEIRDEIVTSFDEILDLRGGEWKSIPALGVTEKIVCRVSNRAFVGLPLCRDPDWIDLNIHYAMDTIMGGATIGLFPSFMRTLATRLFTNAPRNVARAVRHLRPIIEERRRYQKGYGTDYGDKPNDLLSCLMEQTTKGPEQTVLQLAIRILIVNLASIHATSNLFSLVLLRLAANPHYIQPLREEVEGIIENEGWSRTALNKMRRIDSFLMECQRINGINTATMTRKALRDFTFSDGTFIPKGTMVASPAASVHHDSNLYDNPEVFEPFRFIDDIDKSEEDATGPKYHFTSTSTKYLPFGHGKHACPGRFLVADELKSILAHLVVAYDVKLEDGVKCPTSSDMGIFVVPNPKAKVMIRSRVTVD